MQESQSTGETSRRFTVKFLDSKDVVVSIGASSTVKDLIQELGRRMDWTESCNVRLIGEGKELYPGDSLQEVRCSMLHCVVTTFKPKAAMGRDRTSVDVAHLDWFDVIDPSTMLMWVFGLMLALFWTLFFCRGQLFDKASVAMLVVMTLAFVIPCAINHWNWPLSWQASSAPQAPENAPGDSTSVSYGCTNSRDFSTPYIPPRPHAPVEGLTTSR